LPSDALKSELAEVNSEIAKNEYYLKSLFENLCNNIIDDTEYKELKMDYEVKIASLTERKGILQEGVLRQEEKEKKLLEAGESVRLISGAQELKADVIDKLIDKVHVYKDGRIRVKFHYLDDEVYSGEEEPC
jgi:bifunctional N-acetylglucosamine-1-phosphate-uridyltransferase/glucosamine-1-phosphate-acetyltransferase GlmU-like protein